MSPPDFETHPTGTGQQLNLLEQQQRRIELLEQWIVELNGFRAVAASCIKSGESWTPTMQAAFDRSERPRELDANS